MSKFQYTADLLFCLFGFSCFLQVCSINNIFTFWSNLKAFFDFTQSVICGVIRCRLGYLIKKKCFFSLKNDHFTRRSLPQCERYLNQSKRRSTVLCPSFYKNKGTFSYLWFKTSSGYCLSAHQFQLPSHLSYILRISNTMSFGHIGTSVTRWLNYYSMFGHLQQ